MASSNPNIVFQWWGPLSASEEMTQLVRRHEDTLRPGHFLGPAADPAPVLAATDILFHPADREAQGISIYEAACAGIPVVCSASVAEVLPPEIHALSFKTGDAQDAEATLHLAIERYAEHAARARASAAIIRKTFGMDRCASAYLRICMNVLEREAEP
jgi:glycosyltransferase involved in cell wall biosynthesis